jgi:hypothetical protein
MTLKGAVGERIRSQRKVNSPVKGCECGGVSEEGIHALMGYGTNGIQESDPGFQISGVGKKQLLTIKGS